MAESNDSVLSRAHLSHVEAAVIDAGLRAHMVRVYNYMALGLIVTAITAMGVYVLSVTEDPAIAAHIVRHGTDAPARLAASLYLTPAGYTLFVSPLKWGIILAPVVLVFFLGSSIERLRPVFAQLLFWFYAALIGVSLGAVFMIYTQTSVARVFFITAAAFGALSLWGYVTRRDLTQMGSFMMMGVFGLVIAGFINLFLASSTVQWIVSVTGVVVFSGLAAWDTQRLKNEYIYGAMDGVAAERSAILGALSLYLDFINLFALLLLSCQRED